MVGEQRELVAAVVVADCSESTALARYKTKTAPLKEPFEQIDDVSQFGDGSRRNKSCMSLYLSSNPNKPHTHLHKHTQTQEYILQAVRPECALTMFDSSG